MEMLSCDSDIKYCPARSKLWFKPPIHFASLLMVFMTLFSLLLMSSCTSTMSLQEAKKVMIDVGGRRVEPPPRKIDDILSVFELSTEDKAMLLLLEKRSNSAVPTDAGNEELAKFYFKRGMASQRIGKMLQSREDLQMAVDLVEKHSLSPSFIHALTNHYGATESFFGSASTAIQAAERSRLFGKGGNSTADILLMNIYVGTGDKKNAERIKRQVVNRTRHWTGSRGRPWKQFYQAYFSGQLAYLNGYYNEAEIQLRKALHLATSDESFKQWKRLPSLTRYLLTYCLVEQGYYVEAEYHSRKAMRDSVSLDGKYSWALRRGIETLGRVLFEQKRYQEAELLLQAYSTLLEKSKIPKNSLTSRQRFYGLGTIMAEQEKWAESLNQLNLSMTGLKVDSPLYRRFMQRTTFPLVLLRNSQDHAAQEILEKSLEISLHDLGPDHYHTAEIEGLLAVVEFREDNLISAQKRFVKAIPILLVSGNRLSQQKKLIFESYMEFLDQVRGTPIEQQARIDAVLESLKMAEAIKGKSVQQALAKSLARSAIRDPKISELARRSQDTEMRLKAMETALSNHLSIPVNQQDSQVLAGLRVSIKHLREAQDVIQKEVKKASPEYAQISHPSPVDPMKLKDALKEKESLIYIYSAVNRSFVWAISKNKDLIYASIPVGVREIEKKVRVIRDTLDPDFDLLEDIPDFDHHLGYQLFETFLNPIREGWKDAEELIIVVSGPLGQIPFSVLPTKPVLMKEDKELLFESHRRIPYLIRSYAITRSPALSSFIALRSHTPKTSNRAAFAGFGNPIFNMEKATESVLKNSTEISNRGRKLKVRGIRVSSMGNLDNSDELSSQLKHLQPLPDTQDEILSIAESLGAKNKGSVFLGKDASEHRVKNMDLSDRKVIAFASHALIPGDLDGLDQPAIAMSAPTGQNKDEDGLLTMEEIFGLQLNADWIVLSACNTAAGEGKGKEAVSGLGRAFFYAGSKALLVSMWPVETTSAKKLTTTIFKQQKADKTLSRAKALQKTLIDMIDNQVLKDEPDGDIIAAYAHPFFWAPFIIIGDGG